MPTDLPTPRPPAPPPPTPIALHKLAATTLDVAALSTAHAIHYLLVAHLLGPGDHGTVPALLSLATAYYVTHYMTSRAGRTLGQYVLGLATVHAVTGAPVRSGLVKVRAAIPYLPLTAPVTGIWILPGVVLAAALVLAWVLRHAAPLDGRRNLVDVSTLSRVVLAPRPRAFQPRTP